MSELTFEELEQLQQSDGAEAAIERLIDGLRSQKEYHRLFDALLLRKKHQMGLPLTRPTSFEDIPDERRQEFEQTYIASAREVGELLLADGRIPQAFMYFQAIRETEPVRRAIEALPLSRASDEASEEVMNIAFFHGVHPVKGVELMLRSHGTCSTITSLDQQFSNLAADIRRQCAAVMVKSLYHDLTENVRQDVLRKMPVAPPSDSLRELIAGRDWMFADGNYHIDVSHLNAVVRFARALEPSSPELRQAIELAEYGSHLAEQFQYPGDPPFDEFYPAHIRYFKVLADVDRDDSLGWFRNKLEQEPDDQDKQLIAYVIVDLLVRIGRWDEAVPLAEQYLIPIDEQYGFSFADLCQRAGRMDALRNAARQKGDFVTYTAALVQGAGV